MRTIRDQHGIPLGVQRYFWDADVSQIDIKTNQEYIISRILEHGDVESAKWLLRAYSREDISAVLKKSRSISAKSGMFWASFLEIPFNDLLCLKKSFRQLQKSHWNA